MIQKVAKKPVEKYTIYMVKNLNDKKPLRDTLFVYFKQWKTPRWF